MTHPTRSSSDDAGLRPNVATVSDQLEGPTVTGLAYVAQPPQPAARDMPGAREILDGADIHRAITRIAHELLERNRGLTDVVVLGIPTRGVVLSSRLARVLARVEGISVEQVAAGALDITMYRDDLRLRPTRALEQTVLPARGIDGANVVLVDDVLFSGRTLRAALDALAALGRPKTVQLAVLVDRGHRELPVRADYVGKNIPTARSESVRVLLAETDGRDAVLLGTPAHHPGQTSSSGELV